MAVNYTNRRLVRARDEKLSPEQLAFAELTAIGWSPIDAAIVLGLVSKDDDEKHATAIALSYAANSGLEKIHKKRIKQFRAGVVSDGLERLHPTPGGRGDGRGVKPGTIHKQWENISGSASDEEVLDKMWETITSLAKDDPKRVDLLDKYDKLKRRQGQKDEEDTTIHFYLPRPECDTCPMRGTHIINDPEIKKDPEPTIEQKVEELFKPVAKRRGRPRKQPPAEEPPAPKTNNFLQDTELLEFL